MYIFRDILIIASSTQPALLNTYFELGFFNAWIFTSVF